VTTLDLLLEHLLRRHEAFHDFAREDPAKSLAIRHPRIVLEPHWMRGAGPGRHQRMGVLARNVDVKMRVLRPFDEFILLEIIPLGLQDREDRLRGGVSGEALPKDEDVERVDARRLKANVRGDFAGRVHLRDAGREQQALGRELLSPMGFRVEHPILFARCVGVVASRGEAGLGDFRAIFAERADHVADDFGAVEQFGEAFDAVLHLGDFVFGGFNPRDFVHHRLGPRAIAAGSEERHVQLAQIFADEPTRVAGRAVDDNGLLVGHDFVSSACSFFRPAAGLAPTFPFRHRPEARRR
jgi:hypothetical protein